MSQGVPRPALAAQSYRYAKALFLTQSSGIYYGLSMSARRLHRHRSLQLTPMGPEPMKTGIGITAALLLIGGYSAHAQQRVTVTGCPAPGVEVNCLLIRGSDNKTYNISGARLRPAIGQRAIRLTGTPSRKASYCQQGIVLDNITWVYTDQTCQ
jgi:hypothetical protein